MPNALRNAGFLDGADSWTTPRGTLAVDEVTLGAPGRAVLTDIGTTGASNETEYVESAAATALAVGAGQPVEAYAQWSASIGSGSIGVAFYTSGASLISVLAVPQIYTAIDAPALGVREAYNRSWGQLVAPASTASARLRLISAVPGASGQAFTLALLKPYLALPDVQTPGRFDPGSHTNSDLAAIPAWPSSLPPFLADQGQAKPYPNRADFTGDAGIPSVNRLYPTLQHDFTGQMRLSRLQFAQLMAFFTAGAPLFYFARPDTDELCFASWSKGGEPTVSARRGPWLMVNVGLKLRVA